MSENAAKKIFESLVELAPGLKDFVPEVGAELSRLFDHGRNEGASLLNTGHAFVMYGSGQYTPDATGVHGPQQEPDAEHQHEMGIER